MKTVCYFTAVCEADAEHVDRYIADAQRLGIPFCIHFDRCSPVLKERFRKSFLLVGETSQDLPEVEFNEQHKQPVLDLVCLQKFDWACAMDIDETWEREVRPKIETILDSDYDLVDVKWLNLWDSPKTIRVDPPFGEGHRVKFLNLRRRHQWHFDHPITNGVKSRNLPGQAAVTRKHNLVCLHWGILTRELRLEHKARWDRIYTKAVGANPYGFWQGICDETWKPRLEEHDYL